MTGKLKLLKNLADYCYDHDAIISDKFLDPILAEFKPLLENLCEVCGGGMCIPDHCPVFCMLKELPDGVQQQ